MFDFEGMNVDSRVNHAHCDSSMEDDLKRLLLFRRVVKVETIDNRTAHITLDNGVILHVRGNEGCGGCENGWYYLSELNICDNAITDVRVQVNDAETEFSIFVFADNSKVNLVSYTGDDNGWYGTGFYLTAYLPK